MHIHAIIKLLNPLIIFLILLNIFYFLTKNETLKLSHLPHPTKFPTDFLFIPQPIFNKTVHSEDLHRAVTFLNLPVWSRGYVTCLDPQSEVTCAQIIHAYHVIKGWENNISETPTSKRKYFIIKHPVKGLGNKMMTDIIGFTLALMSNRTVLVTSNIPTPTGVKNFHAYEYPSSVLTSIDQLSIELQKSAKNFKELPTDPSFCCFDINSFIHSSDQFIGINDLLYSPMIYANFFTSKWCRDNFGLHAAYFIGNYFSRFPNNTIKKALHFLSKVPPNKKVIGVHFRYHRAGQYYSHGLNQSLPVMYEEIDRRLAKEDMYIALATDNNTIKDEMVSRYGNRIVLTRALRKPDKDHFSALIDMAMLLGSNELIGTYRSTFSWIVVSKFGRRAWWIEKESMHCFPASNSQSVGISIIYHWRDNCNWRTNDRIKYCGLWHRETLQYFYDYLVM